ncbi:MAG: uncharacterized protein QOI54_1678 [Actinomycetota bacterium]|jgi:uncharacterized protein (DUF1684 family)|nr:uncharacterized protein [Actinomycetota bacterium]
MSLSLLDWRRRVGALYAEVRAATDPADGHRLWRRGRDELFAGHPQTPLLPPDRAVFTGLPYAPYDPALRFTVEVDPDVAPQRMQVQTGTDGVVPFQRIGVAHLDGLGDLDVWWLATYGGGVFLPLKDATAGTATYGGGRYVLDTAKGADLGGGVLGSSLVVDLNFAYNPSCAYDPAWACPLAPAGNTLAAPVWGGELYGSGGC